MKSFLRSELDGGDHARDDPHQPAHTDDDSEPEGDSVLRDGRLVVRLPVSHVGAGGQLLAVYCLILGAMVSLASVISGYQSYIEKVDRGVVRH